MQGFVVPTSSEGLGYHKSLVIQSVIQHMCQFYEPRDPEKCRRLFVEICKSFTRMKIFDQDAFTGSNPLRDQYTGALERLVQVAHTTVRTGGKGSDNVVGGSDAVDGIAFPRNLLLPPAGGLPHPTPTPLGYGPALGFAGFHYSRYTNEFEELEFIAKGGFGSVFKARNRLDNVTYAVKKIILKHRGSQQLFAKILREVTTLARLSHPNIVCYKTAWMEPRINGRTAQKLEKSAASAAEDTEESVSQSISGAGIKFTVGTESTLDASLDSRDISEDSIIFASTNASKQKESIIFSEGRDFSSKRNESIIFAESSDFASQRNESIIFAESGDFSSRQGLSFSNQDFSSQRLDSFSEDFSSKREDSEDGIIFLNADSSGATFKKNTSKHILMQNVLSLREVDSSEDAELTQNCVRVKGLAATPPNAGNGMKLLQGSMKSSNQFRGKFWNKSNSFSSSSASQSQRFALTRTAAAATGNTSTYWAKTFLDEQTRKWEHILDFDARCEAIPLLSEKSDQAILFVQMQLCEKTLRCWLDERNEISHFKNVQIFRQILLGVEYIHSQNIIHRDLKPRNVFVSGRGVVQIGDFGLAKADFDHEGAEVVSPESPFDTTSASPWAFDDRPPKEKEKETSTVGTTAVTTQVRHSRRHTSGVGTQAYASPEQLRDGTIDFKSDMYSLGIILFELYNCFTTGMERSRAITDLRERAQLPKNFATSDDYCGLANDLPRMVLRLTSGTPAQRPSSTEVLQTTFTKAQSDQIKIREENRLLRLQLNQRDQTIHDLSEELAKLKAQMASAKVNTYQ